LVLARMDTDNTTPSADTRLCPECEAPVPAGAVLCIECGTVIKTGARLKVDVPKEEPAKRPRKPVANGMLILAGAAAVVFIAIAFGLLFVLSKPPPRLPMPPLVKQAPRVPTLIPALPPVVARARVEAPVAETDREPATGVAWIGGWAASGRPRARWACRRAQGRPDARSFPTG